MNDQPPLPVDVEALVSEIALRSCVAIPFRGRDLAVVRKGEGLHQNVLIVDSNQFFGTCDRRRMSGMKWIKGFQGQMVHLEADPAAPGFTGEESMEYQLQVGPGLVQLPHKVGPHSVRNLRCPSRDRVVPQTTSVPLEPMCSVHGMDVRSSRTWTCHLPDSAM